MSDGMKLQLAAIQRAERHGWRRSTRGLDRTVVLYRPAAAGSRIRGMRQGQNVHTMSVHRSGSGKVFVWSQDKQKV